MYNNFSLPAQWFKLLIIRCTTVWMLYKQNNQKFPNNILMISKLIKNTSEIKLN